MINNWLQKYNYILAQPYWLWLLLIIPLIILYKKYFKKEKQTSYWLMPNLPKGLKHYIPLKMRLRPLLEVLKYISLGLMIIALAKPQKTDTNKKIETEGIDIVLSLDVSGSMLAEDFKPNRLESAKKLSKSFVESREGDRIGLVIFAGESFTQCPVTMDFKILLEQIDAIKSGVLIDGTTIGNGLATAVNSLRNAKGKSKVVILMTDGMNQKNQGLNINPEDAMEIAKTFGVKVYTIGIGTIGQALAPVYGPDGSVYKQMVDVKIDEPLLQQIAKHTGGKYYRATDNASLKAIYDEIDALEKSSVEMSVNVQYTDLFYWFLLPAMLILLIESILRNSYFKTITPQ